MRPPVHFPVTAPLASLYRVAVAARNARYDRGRGVRRFDIPVISVGNLTVGGTGKTPVVAWLCRTLLDGEHHPMIAMRGYASTPDGVSDEAMEYRQRFGERVPIVAQPDRTTAIDRMRKEHTWIDCVVLDDGFQHRRIARDLDIVLIDATQRTFEDHLLPVGRLREPTSSLRRADAVIVTRAEARSAALDYAIEQAHGQPPLAHAVHRWSRLDVFSPIIPDDEDDDKPGGIEAQHQPCAWLDGKRLATCFGTGNPKPIEDQAKRFGAVIRRRLVARDHQVYDRSFLARVQETLQDTSIEALMVTPKDWVKLAPHVRNLRVLMPIVVPRLRMHFDDGADVLRRRLFDLFTPVDAHR